MDKNLYFNQCKLSTFIISEMCDKPKMYSIRAKITASAKFINEFSGSLLQKSQEIAKVWKLAKMQLCDSNFTPPYHENTL
jgi:hypothetical protein